MNHWEILSLLRNLALNVDANYSNIFCTFISGPDSEINVIHLVSKIKNALHFPYVCPTKFFLFCNCLTLSRFKINQGQDNGLPHWLALLRIIESVCKLMLSSWSLLWRWWNSLKFVKPFRYRAFYQWNGLSFIVRYFCTVFIECFRLPCCCCWPYIIWLALYLYDIF